MDAKILLWKNIGTDQIEVVVVSHIQEGISALIRVEKQTQREILQNWARLE